MLENLKALFFTIKDISTLIVGLITYIFRFNAPYFKRTSQQTNIALVNIFCRTKGKSNDFLNTIISLFDKPVSFPHMNGVLGNLSTLKLQEITNVLNKDGYYVFPNKLPEHMCEELLEFAKSTKFDLNLSDEDILNGEIDVKKDYYNRNNPKATKYTLDSDTCINKSSIQKIFSDFSILSVAQSYLKSSPKLDLLGMWWNTNFSKKAQKESAEFFHFDLDRPKWLKFFIYLTDVTDDSGPHQFVRGSHRTAAIPNQILKQGYARITDEEVNQLYDPKDIIKFTAPKGTIIAEDTRGLHKATKIHKGDRLMLQLQYSNTLFGTITPYARLKNIQCENLQYIFEEHQNLLALYLSNKRNDSTTLNLDNQPIP